MINGVGTVTVLGGSIMPPEVVEAMVEASKHFIQLPELQKKVGERIAELLKVPAAMVSCGAASAITVATAACVAGGDPDQGGPSSRHFRVEKRNRAAEKPPQRL